MYMHDERQWAFQSGHEYRVTDILDFGKIVILPFPRSECVCGPISSGRPPSLSPC